MTGSSGHPHGIRLGDRPLIVCDVDEVVLEFLTPFQSYLESREHELRPQSFRLNGNIFSRKDGKAATDEQNEVFLEDFFAEQHAWQTPVAEAGKALASLASHADVVFLTAMPPRHYAIRRGLLDRFDLRHPMIATEQAKGPAVKALHGERPLPLAFIDDIFTNLHSVRRHTPSAFLVNMMANDAFRALAPHPGDGVAIARDWPHAEAMIADHFGLHV